MTVISYVYRILAVRIIEKNGRITGNDLVLVVEVLTIQDAVKHATQQNNTKIIIESDSLIAIQAINWPSPLF